ncbi:hypothetical protein HDU76_013710 [Blyttiomyces sp. JEL0837]|nr:hypothetical protein HDU76_013710 [Blyttiomyces sp. JEL0837]
MDRLEPIEVIVALLIGYGGTLSLAIWKRTDFLIDQVLQVETQNLDIQMYRSANLLRAILPAHIMAQVINNERSTKSVDQYHEMSVLHLDVTSFTVLSSSIAPDAIINLLNVVFTKFDQICRSHNIEKIITIGDAYVAGRLDLIQPSHADFKTRIARSAIAACITGLQMQRCMKTCQRGRTKIKYELLGDAVEIAEKVQEKASPGLVFISQTTMDALENHFDVWKNMFTTEETGQVVQDSIACFWVRDREKYQ